RALIVRDVEFMGNEFFSAGELALRIQTRPNRRFLGIPGVTWWLWLYELGESGALGKRVGQALMRGGELPAYLDSAVLHGDVYRLRLVDRQVGVRGAAVEAELATLDGSRVDVRLLIDAGTPTFIRQITYEGAEHLTPGQQYRMTRATVLQTRTASRE